MQDNYRRQDGQKLPFYIAYPFSENLREQEAEDRDFEALVDLYPASAKKLWPQVEELCDQMEYDGSVMYDECPDKYKIRRMAEELCANADEEEEDLLAQSGRRRGNPLEDIVQMLFVHEMHRRRCRRRRHKCHFLY